MARFLITGASGFIGRSVIVALQQHGDHDIYGVSWGKSKVPLAQGVTWGECNLIDPDAVENMFRSIRPELLIHLAWCADPATYWSDPVNLDWLNATLNIARSFSQNGGKRAIFAGTSAEYDWSDGLPLKEFETQLKPQRLYGSCKLACYWSLKGYCEQIGLSWAWARFFNPFGPYEDSRRLIPKTCLKLLAGEGLKFDAAMSRRDFLHVDDVGAALTALAVSEVQGAVNLASGAPVRVRDVVVSLAQYLGREALVEFSGENPREDSVVADVTRLREEVGWSPALGLNERLAQTCAWWGEALSIEKGKCAKVEEGSL